MHRTSPILLALSACILVCCVPARAQDRIPDAEIQAAIDAGVAFLLSRQEADGSWPDLKGGGVGVQGDDRKIGVSALVTYSLLASGKSIHDEPMKKALKYLEHSRTEWNYAIALRCQAYLQAWKQDKRDPKYRSLLRKDAHLLVRAAAEWHKTHGAYSYRLDRASVQKYSAETFDLSNAQYGLLGVWAAYQANLEVPNLYWQYCYRFWKGMQDASGGWPYNLKEKRVIGTMSAAGLASTFVCVDALMGGEFRDCGRDYEVPALKKGLAWFDENFAKTMKDSKLAKRYDDYPYYLFGVERVALASGYKSFGGTEWYQAGAAWILKRQDKKSGKVVNDHGTAYSLLFLVRGQHPVLINHLIHNGDWNNRPRALATLTRWMSDELERDLNWQIIDPATDVGEWHDAPILLLTGAAKLELTDAQIESLRTYAYQGGTIMTVRECRGTNFTRSVEEVYKTLFPTYELTDVPADDPLYTLHFKDLGGKPAVKWVHNGLRPLAVHVDNDLPLAWQLNQTRTRPDTFQIVANLGILVTDWNLRNRGTNYWPPEPKGTDKSVTVVRVTYTGNCNPEPLALEHFARTVGAAEKLDVKILPPTPATDLAASGANVAFLTCTGQLTLSGAEQKGLKDFVDAGGTVVVDAALGSRKATDAARKALRGAFDVDRMDIVPPRSDLFALPGHEIESVVFTRTAAMRSSTNKPRFQGVEVNGRWALLFSPEDLTLGLLGRSVNGNEGYSADSAYQLVRNILLYEMDKTK